MLRFRSAVGLVIAVLLVTLGDQALAEDRGLGARPPTTFEQAYIDAVYSEVVSVVPNALARDRARAESARAGVQISPTAEDRPALVDNSVLACFPPIRSQGSQGSCTAWASCYYFNTFLQAKDEGYDVSGGDDDHICSPAFMYPLVNGGRDDGASVSYSLARLNEVGASSWTLKPYSPSDYTSWPSEAAWVDALANRTQSSHYASGFTASGLDVIKQHLANGNLAVVSFSVYRTFYDSYPADGDGINNGVYYAQDGSSVGGHAVTLVGYDDNKSYADHRDGRLHHGAFLLANSWGPRWGVTNSTGSGTEGFFWVAYSMFLDGAFGPNVYYNTDREDYRPSLYAVAGLNHERRDHVALRSGVDGSVSWTSHYAVSFAGGAFALEDTARIAIDMTDGEYAIAQGGTSSLSAQLNVNQAAASSGTIASADFYEDLDGDGTYALISSGDPTVSVAPGGWGYATATITPHFVEVSASADSGTVLSGWSTSLYASYVASAGHGIASWQWSDGGAGGSFSPSAAVQNPTYTAPQNTSLEDLVVHLTVTATCDGQPPANGSGAVDLTVRPVGVFSDVALDFWSFSYIRSCVMAGIVGGYEDGSYRPDGLVDRAAMATFVSRALAGGDANVPSGPAVASFGDVPTDHWAYRYVEYARSSGVVQGYPDGYRPDDRVDRGQMAVFIARAMASPTGEDGLDSYMDPETPTFTDVDTDFWAYRYIEYIAGAGVTSGYEDGTYRPDILVTRDQMAVYVQKAFDLPT